MAKHALPSRSASSPSFIFWRCLALSLAAVGLIALSGMIGQSGPAAQADPPPKRLPDLPPFLEVFDGPEKPPIVTHSVHWPTATGKAAGFLTRRKSEDRLPGLILIPESKPDENWYRRSARELAEVGYVVLRIKLTGSTPPPASGLKKTSMDAQKRRQFLNDLFSAVRWLRRREDVFPDRIGAIGFSAGGTWAWILASQAGLQAGVNCNGSIPEDPAFRAGLRHTTLMGVWNKARFQAAESRTSRLKSFLEDNGIAHQFQIFEEAPPGFMNPANTKVYHHNHAEDAWFLIYEFLGEHVEDVHIKRLLAKRNRHGHHHHESGTATIAELMRALNAATGLRGRLSESLNEKPAEESAWQGVTARAAVLVETGTLLLDRQPPQGTRSGWIKQVEAYRQAARALHKAGKMRDYPQARAALKRLGKRCAACHLDHR